MTPKPAGKRLLSLILLVYIIQASFLGSTTGVDKAIDLAFQGHTVYYVDAVVGTWKFYKVKGEVKMKKMDVTIGSDAIVEWE